MSKPSDFVTIRRLPDGRAQPARMTDRTADRVTVAPAGEDWVGLETGSLVEIDAPEVLYLGEIAGCQPDSLVVVSVEHFVDRAALAEIESVWKPAAGA
jgi:hypothetical protein